ncbi:MAG: response regulator transcription factor [Anaerococcus sp.]|nr:response regulator transcription factor [Peptoniphilaceae bacterium]MDY3054926.1 response regulator transcription factor [Anaerococcus sp.]
MKILIIEDNISLVRTLKDVFESKDHYVDYYTDLDQIDDYIVLNSYDLIILDVMLGSFSGLDFLKMIRKDIKKPIILLTAKDTKEDIIKGFGLGADDYITKPFDMDILLARVGARLSNKHKEIYYKDTKFDFDRFLVSNQKDKIQLTSVEAEILKLLYENKGRYLTKEEILNNTSASFKASERVIVSHIYNIRQKLLSIDGDDPIENKWKVGYRWKEN